MFEGTINMQEFEIVFYDKPDGSEPVKEFLLSVDDKMRARLLRTINLLAQNGTTLRMPYSEHLVDGIFEIRAKVGSNISRVLYFFVIGKRIVLTNGFVKKHKRHPKAKLSLQRNIETNF